MEPAISVPAPDRPPVLTPLETGTSEPSRPSAWRKAVTPIGIAAVAFTLGWLARPNTPVPPARPDVAATLAWMFDAALAHAGSDSDGAPQPPAVGTVAVRQVETIDPATGPLLALVALDGQPAAYEIAVERRGLDWTVRALQLTPDVSRSGS